MPGMLIICSISFDTRGVSYQSFIQIRNQIYQTRYVNLYQSLNTQYTLIYIYITYIYQMCYQFIIEYSINNSKMDKEIHINHTFNDTGLSPFICRLLAHNQYSNPTPIQYYAIKTGIDNQQHNLVCRSKSGTGKTLAYLGLVLQFVVKMISLEDKTYCIILLPTRELAVQVYHTFKTILDTVGAVKTVNLSENHVQGIFSNIQIMLTIGGISYEDDRNKYRHKPANLMISTVGRMFQLVKNNVLILNQDMMLILDEGDKLLANKDDKFNKVINVLPKSTKWVIFSATYSNKMLEELAKIKKFTYVQTMLKNHQLEVVISDNIDEQIKNINQNPQKTNLQCKKAEHSQMKTKNEEGLTENIHLDNIKKYQYKLQTENDSIFDSKMKALKGILSQLNYQKCLIFVQKKSFLQQISQGLDQFEHVLIHGSLSQAARFRMMNQINSAKIIVASDLLSRGIDIKLDLVILFDARQTDTFWHRIGRTGRYGRTGIAVSLDSIQDQQWHQYNKQEINSILTDIQSFQKKSWYGGHMTQIGKWTDVNQKKQQLNDYKYFDESKLESTLKAISKTENQVKNKLQQIQINKADNSDDKLNFKSKQQLQNFIKNKIMKCTQCMDLIKGTTALTGYKFQIFDYVSEETKQKK